MYVHYQNAGTSSRFLLTCPFSFLYFFISFLVLLIPVVLIANAALLLQFLLVYICPLLCMYSNQF
jgi:hypothetical protein